jgi:hypothetical protein
MTFSDGMSRAPLRASAVILALLASLPAWGQRATDAATPEFVFADVPQAREILGTRDDYVRATAPLERKAKLKTAEPVDEERFLQHMRGAPLEWSPQQRKNLEPLVGLLARFLSGVRWKMPGRIVLVQVGPALEDDFPHTRGNAIIAPASYYGRGPTMMLYLLAHETFHILTRANPELRETLYSAIGFKRCDSVVVPPEIAALRLTNPDAIESRHTISVRYRGEPVEALPYVRFPSADIDPRQGFMKQVKTLWLLVDRKDGECRARSGPDASVDPERLEGLFEQIGRNTDYLFHPEEILADNFAQIFIAETSKKKPPFNSPELIDRLRKILLENP